MGRFGRIALKTILWIIASVIFLVLLVVVLIQVPGVQNFVKDKAVTFLEKKIKTKVEIGHISLGLPKLLVLEDVYFEDQKKDTLIAGDKLKVDISMLQLLHNKVEINEINLQGITANISRGPDSLFNFDYILKAFAGEQKKEVKPEDTTSTMKFSMDKIILDRINVKYKDVISGNDVKFWVGHFDTRIKDFDLDKMKFSVPKITLSGVNATVIQTAVTPPPPDTTTSPLNLDLTLGTIDLSKIKVVYRTVEMDANVDLSQFLVEMDKLDLKNQSVAIKSISLNDTKAFLTFAKPKTVAKQVEKTIKKLDTLASNPTKNAWRASIAKVSFVNDEIKFDNEAQKPLTRGMDFGHMHIRALNADITELAYSPDTIKGKVNSFTFKEKSGLAVNKFRTTFLYGPTSAYLNDLLLETPQTVIQKRVQVSYPSIEAISKNIGSLKINANVDGTKIGLRDILLLMPTMASMEPFKSSPNSVFRIDGRVEGSVSNLNIPNFEVRGLRNTHIKASARLRGLPDMNKAYFDVNLADFNTSAADIAKLAPKGSIPPNIRVPDNMNLKGTFKGSMSNFNTKLSLRTNLGAADVVAAMKNGNNKKGASYVANIRASNLNVGAITKQPQTVGMITLAANVKGRGLDPKTANLAFDGNVVSAYVKGYNYKNLKLKGTAVNGAYTVATTMRDPNINFALNAKANLNKKYPAVTANLMLDSIDLHALKLSATPLRLHGKIVADVPTADPDYLNANIKATNLLVVNKDQRIKVDSISVISTANADSSALRLKTPFLNARMSGKYKLTEVGAAMQDMINKYFDTSLGTAKPAAKSTYSPQQFTFSLRIIKTPLLNQFAPTLTTLDPVNITGRFNSSTGEFVANGTIPKVVYGTQIVNNGKLNINTANNALNYALTVDEVKIGSSLDLLYPSITGKAQDNKLNVSVQVRDAERKERYRIAGVLSALPNEFEFSFLQDGVMFNYVPWSVSADNSLQFGGKGILARNFAITNANQVLSVNSVGTDYNSPLKVAFRDFKIETITQMAQQDSLQVGGVINGEANISDLQSAMKFTAQLDVQDFSFKGDTVGNIALKVNNQTENAYAANMSITGKGNEVDLKGVYYATPASRFDLDLSIVRLNMKSIEGFSFGAIRNAKGAITGQLKITGTTSAPQVRGDVNFNDVGFNVSMLNSYFTMPKEVITFNEDGVLFRDFTLVDSTGNKAIVSGTLYTKTFTDYRFGIDINANNFRAVNSTKQDNKLFYGKLFIDTRIQIRGNMDAPKVDANLTVRDETDMTFVLPSDDPGVVDRKGVVEVIDQDAPKLDSILLAKQLDSLKQSDLKGLDVNATIKVSKAANFNIVIDERNGDVVNIRGEANLQGGIDPSGKINLTGTYEVEQGSYNLSYATVSRTFNFKKGSIITWTGDPTSAMVDLTAVYVANVPPIDLVAQQDDGSINNTMLKQKLPFNVNLNLKNELLKPDISFDIVLPDSNYTVSPQVIDVVNARLAQIRANPNELNKQVLGVLVLGHFIGDNPLQSAGGSTGVNGAIRNSVSSLLSDQLNRLAGNLGGGVQLSFGVTSGADYSTGVEQNRTDLNVGLSKQFLNDRLTVTVGNNFNLEGQNQPGQKSSQIAGNLSVNYKLTPDGRYMLRAYRRDQFVVVQGQVVETGLAFSLTYEYNRFKELFRGKSREERRLQKEYKEKQKAKEKAQKEADKAHDEKVEEPVLQPADKPADSKESQE